MSEDRGIADIVALVAVLLLGRCFAFPVSFSFSLRGRGLRCFVGLV